MAPFDLWSLCKIEEYILNEKSNLGACEKNQTYGTMRRRKRRFGKYSSQKGKRTWKIFNVMGVKFMGTTRDIVER